jgi:hypothetical protein
VARVLGSCLGDPTTKCEESMARSNLHEEGCRKDLREAGGPLTPEQIVGQVPSIIRRFAA